MREHRARQVADGYWLLEAPRWHAGQLSVCDVLERRRHVLCDDGGSMRCIDSVDAAEPYPADDAVLLHGGRTLVVAEMWSHRVTAFERTPDGRLTRPRCFARLPGREPGGLCADAEGGVWVACFNTGEVLRVVDGGRITDRIACARHAIACTLGGDNGRTLFCTAYTGSVDDMDAGRRLAVIYAAVVPVPGAARRRTAVSID
ncbi:MAG: SMP-30/gluconolactonase/LRE family protein [Piscinibacter sp.]|uniref:SMP-30/gluconolactonase/LRE family protein n=1 Tax=Piscinibacter TaxID=1114981 RepID=UPI000FDE6E56|nr:MULTISPECIES: SMP-30/gluconolactonase/LRE family protein [Piscinibacter]MCW5666277.1 SMP-30/gluconolactonase/LRE family protein [Piscinibacter sp.]